MRHSSRGPLPAAFAIAGLAVVAFLTLGPRWVIAPLHGAFRRGMDALFVSAGASMPWDDERLLNAVMFVPLGAAVAALLPRGWWFVGVLAGAGVSTLVEILQAGVPGRVPDATDVLWNTIGAALGAVVVAAVRLTAALVRRALVTASASR